MVLASTKSVANVFYSSLLFQWRLACLCTHCCSQSFDEDDPRRLAPAAIVNWPRCHVCYRPPFGRSLAPVQVFFSSCNSVKFHSELLNYIDLPVMDIHGRQKQQKRTTSFFQFCKQVIYHERASCGLGQLLSGDYPLCNTNFNKSHDRRRISCEGVFHTFSTRNVCAGRMDSLGSQVRTLRCPLSTACCFEWGRQLTLIAERREFLCACATHTHRLGIVVLISSGHRGTTLHGRCRPRARHPCRGLDNPVRSSRPDCRIHPQGRANGQGTERTGQVQHLSIAFCGVIVLFFSGGGPLLMWLLYSKHPNPSSIYMSVV